MNEIDETQMESDKTPTVEQDLKAAEERRERLARFPDGAETALAADSLIKAIEEKVPVLCFDCKEVLADEGGEDFCSALCLECGKKRTEPKKENLTLEAKAWDATKGGVLPPGWKDAPEAIPANSKPTRIVVVAKTAGEMEVAQKELITWVDKKMAELKTELTEAEENLKLFTKNKWRTDPSKRAVAKAQKNYEYYGKMKAALEAGYVIIPNMPNDAYDVFAIRTTAKSPRQNQTSGTWNRGTKDQVTNSPALKEGKYVSPDAVENSITNTITKPDGKKENSITVWAEEFMEVAFPFKMAKPQVIEDTAQAMKLGIFDEMIASPKFRTSKPRGDPMIMGRILIREGYHTKAVTFLITWFVDSKDL